MKSKIMKILSFWWIVPILTAFLACFATQWVFDTYDAPSFEQILFHLTEPVVGFETTLLYSFLIKCVLISIVDTAVVAYVICRVEKKIKNPVGIKALKGCISLLTIVIIIICLYLLGFFEYLVIKDKKSTFIEDNYVHPMKIDIKFPEEKRNLIYIYAESLESSYLSIDEGGLQEENLLPELTALAKENITFSDTDKIGGAYELNGTSWTTAAMVSQTAGIPLKLGKTVTNHLKLDYFLGGVFTLGDLLFLEGYNQSIMFGSDGDFGNRKTYFKQHGFYNVLDYYDAIDKGRIPDDYLVFWGYEDSKLFEYAKEEILTLSKEDKPFNFTLLTVNTHSPEGYLEESCPKKYKDYYSNAIACSSYQINEFIEWCMEQDFYENTTIILTGDHLSMSKKVFKHSESDNRRVFNTFINSAIEPVKSTNRDFSTMDMFPTTLAALGAEIEGNRLGLGTNLFSEEKTLIEKYGFEEVNNQIRYKSDFYNNKLLLMNNE